MYRNIYCYSIDTPHSQNVSRYEVKATKEVFSTLISMKLLWSSSLKIVYMLWACGWGLPLHHIHFHSQFKLGRKQKQKQKNYINKGTDMSNWLGFFKCTDTKNIIVELMSGWLESHDWLAYTSKQQYHH